MLLSNVYWSQLKLAYSIMTIWLSPNTSQTRIIYKLWIPNSKGSNPNENIAVIISSKQVKTFQVFLNDYNGRLGMTDPKKSQKIPLIPLEIYKSHYPRAT